MALLLSLRSPKAWFSIAIAFAICFSAYHSAQNVNHLGELNSGRQLFSAINFKDPATITLKDAHQEGGSPSIGVNPHSTISSDVVDIWQHQRRAEVCLRLKEGSRCPNPSLVGRLSGKSIAMLEWYQVALIDAPFTEYCGSYRNSWLDPGTYFLEIIIIHCNGFGTTAISIAANNLRGGEQNEGRWTLKEGLKLDQDASPRPHFTRYQPQDCRDRTNPEYYSDRCMVPLNNERVEEFSFVWDQDQAWVDQVKKFQVDVGSKVMDEYMAEHSSSLHWHSFHKALEKNKVRINEPPICLMGDSFSQFLWQALFRHSLGHRFIISRLMYPEMDDIIFQLKTHFKRHRCTTFIIAAGQWPASNQAWEDEKYGKPFSFGQFYERLLAIVRSPEIFHIHRDIKIYFRTINQIPIGDFVGDCGVEHRPKDWRSTTVINGYNRIVERVVDEAKQNPKLRDMVHFIDTRFINEPLWDTSMDMNHMHPQVADAEAMYIAGKVLL